MNQKFNKFVQKAFLKKPRNSVKFGAKIPSLRSRINRMRRRSASFSAYLIVVAKRLSIFGNPSVTKIIVKLHKASPPVEWRSLIVIVPVPWLFMRSVVTKSPLNFWSASCPLTFGPWLQHVHGGLSRAHRLHSKLGLVHYRKYTLLRMLETYFTRYSFCFHFRDGYVSLH